MYQRKAFCGKESSTVLCNMNDLDNNLFAVNLQVANSMYNEDWDNIDRLIFKII